MCAKYKTGIKISNFLTYCMKRDVIGAPHAGENICVYVEKGGLL